MSKKFPEKFDIVSYVLSLMNHTACKQLVLIVFDLPVVVETARVRPILSR